MNYLCTVDTQTCEVKGADIDHDAELTPSARRILDVAAELFYRRGITAVGVDTIAAESGVTKRTLYNRFGSKDALVGWYLHERDRRWRDLVETRLTEVDDPARRVLAPFDVLPGWLAASDRGCSFVNAFAELPDADHPGHRVIVAEKRWLAALFRRLLGEAGARDVDDLAAALLSLHEGAVVSHAIAGEQHAARAVRTAAEALVAGAVADIGSGT